jgi:hypothetical protein
MGRNVSQEVVRAARFGPPPEHLVQLGYSTHLQQVRADLLYILDSKEAKGKNSSRTLIGDREVLVTARPTPLRRTSPRFVNAQGLYV